MPDYLCEPCGFTTKYKNDYNRHLNTKKHQQITQNVPFSTQNVPFSTQCVPISTQNVPFSENGINNDRYICEYCNKSYKYRPGLVRHIKHSCQKAKAEDLNEIVGAVIMKEKQHIVQEKINNMTLMHEIKKRDKALCKLTKKLDMVQSDLKTIVSSHTSNNTELNTMKNNNMEMNTMKNSMNTIHNTQNITILNHKDTNMNHLSSNDYKKIIGRKVNCIPEMIRRIHCNNEHPENMNIYIPNIKNSYIMIYESGDWKLKNRNKVIEDLIEDKTCRLEEWIEESADNGLKKEFEEYMDYRDLNYEELTKSIKSQVEMDLYNIRKKVNKKG